MIRKETVFILGAGASFPYGFPIGRRLLLNIVDGLKHDEKPLARNLIDAGFDFNTLNEFSNNLLLSNQPSVDAFLENRTKYIEIGKATIAASLIPCETSNSLVRGNDLSWYEYLFTRMGTTLEEFNASKVSFITFNYDRSLEYSLLGALMFSHGLGRDEATLLLSKKKIIHVYGQLAKPDFLSEKGRAYTDEVDNDAIQKCLSDIRIYTEESSENDAFSITHELLEQARIVCFLGFGYHRLNLQRLKADTLLSDKIMFGSCFGMERAERNRIQGKLSGNIKLGGFLEGNLKFLRRYGVFQ